MAKKIKYKKGDAMIKFILEFLNEHKTLENTTFDPNFIAARLYSAQKAGLKVVYYPTGEITIDYNTGDGEETQDFDNLARILGKLK